MHNNDTKNVMKRDIETINNGPTCWTPEGRPLLGPIGKDAGPWLASGFNVGIGTGGGSAEFLAQWMVNGKPHFDLPIVHADRFANDLSPEAAIESIKACYRKGYRQIQPCRQLHGAGRRLRLNKNYRPTEQ